MSDYYKKIRNNLTAFVSGKDNIILDVGCAEGCAGYEIKKRGLASKVVGVEVNSDAARKAKERLDYVVCGDIEVLCLEELLFTYKYFDYIICGDVLEHLRDPWKQLAKLRSLLKTNGHIIISLPNIRYWSVLGSLVFKGDWHYTDAGILDRTHLRFFTRKTAIELCQQAGFTKILCESAVGRRLDRYLNKVSFGLVEEFISPQWIIVCQN